MSTPNVIRTEQGWPGHFIGAADCLFRRNTLLERGDTRVIVSTVGNYWPGGERDGRPMQIGHERYYETMAFMARLIRPYWQVDVRRELSFDAWWRIGECETDSPGTDLRADRMHEEYVRTVTAELESGWTYTPDSEEQV